MIDTLSLGERQAVQAALFRYIRAMDTADSAALVDAFMPEGIIVKADGARYRANEGLTAFLSEAMTAPDATRRQHYLEPLLFRGTENGIAVLSAYQVAVIGSNGAARLVTQGYYDDRVVRDGAGRWRLASKTIVHQREGKVSGGTSLQGLPPLRTVGVGVAAPGHSDPRVVAAVNSAIAAFGGALTCGDAELATSCFHADGSLSMAPGHVVTGSAGLKAFLTMFSAQSARRYQHRLTPVLVEQRGSAVRVVSYWRVESSEPGLAPHLRTLSLCDDLFGERRREWRLEMRSVRVLEHGAPIFSANL